MAAASVFKPEGRHEKALLYPGSSPLLRCLSIVRDGQVDVIQDDPASDLALTPIFGYPGIYRSCLAWGEGVVNRQIKVGNT